MNKKQIIAELRRSAMEDECPKYSIHSAAWKVSDEFMRRQEFSNSININAHIEYRTFLLFVAHALEDEA